MQRVFQLHLQQSILERSVQVGKFDGCHPSLVCGTTSGKVFIHSPNEQNEVDAGAQNVRFLNINRKISALAVGKFRSGDEGDTLIVGTEANILAYNVEKNSDVFYKDVPDGVNTLLFAPTPSLKATSGVHEKMVVAGGNCSLQGFNHEGSEVFWTVTGDNVRALTMTDVSGHGRKEMIVGSDDFAIRAFDNEDIVHEITETSKLIALAPIRKSLFAYALENGTVGVYKGTRRAWRVKSKNIPTAIFAFDANGNGEKEVIIGWNNGKFEARKSASGEVLFKDMFNSPIAALVAADYLMDGSEQVICCSTEGEVRGYMPATGDMAVSVEVEKVPKEEEEVIKLSKYKSALLAEINTLEAMNSNDGKKATKHTGPRIPKGSEIEMRPLASASALCFSLEIATDTENIIKMITIYEYDVGIFDSESLVIRPKTQSHKAIIPIPLSKHVAAKLDIKVLVGSRGSNSIFHVFEQSYKLPKFAGYYQVDECPKESPVGHVIFKTPMKIPQMYEWIQRAFSLSILHKRPTSPLELYFHSYQDGSPLVLSLKSDETIFRTDNMELAADLVQDMCFSLEWRHLQSLAEFPKQMEDFKKVLMRVDECNAIRLNLTGEMADDSNAVKNLVIRAEDARILNDMSRMRRYYSELFTLNNQLLGEYKKRTTNHEVLLEALKEVNNMIQLAARLRHGNSKTVVVSACRKAIKTNNIHALFYIIKTGKEENQ